jgi:transporter family-2 protein
MKRAPPRPFRVLPPWVLLGLVLVAGTLVAAQAGVNAQLARRLGDPVMAAFVSFAVGTLALGLVVLARRPALPGAAALAGVPWWAWVGGLLGAFFVTVAVVAAPRIGAVTLVALMVTGQFVASLLLDRFGLLGFPERSVSWVRLAGVALLVAGVALVRLG